MQDNVLPLNLVFKYVKLSWICTWHTEPDSLKVDYSELAHAKPIQDLHHPSVDKREHRAWPKLTGNLFLEIVHD